MSFLGGGAKVAVALVTVLVLGAVAVWAGMPEDEQVLVGAGDIARCSEASQDAATAALLDAVVPATVFTLGDNAYESGTAAEFEECYAPTWGRQGERTRPALGDHEYKTENAAGYFDYFGATGGRPNEGYYSYDAGEWHVAVLNGNCEEVGGCEGDAPMLRWLEKDLAANPRTCTLAYWHQPLFSSGYNGGTEKVKPAWEVLHAAGVDVVVNAHDHDYERFAPQDPNGVADPEGGVRQFVVGTGGADLRPFEEIQPNSEVRNADTHGVLKLTLRPADYEWEFVPVRGKTFGDSGRDDCH